MPTLPLGRSLSSRSPTGRLSTLRQTAVNPPRSAGPHGGLRKTAWTDTLRSHLSLPSCDVAPQCISAGTDPPHLRRGYRIPTGNRPEQERLLIKQGSHSPAFSRGSMPWKRRDSSL